MRLLAAQRDAVAVDQPVMAGGDPVAGEKVRLKIVTRNLRHMHAIDATVAEVALGQPKPVTLLTFDSDDMTKLCGDRVRIIPL